jgi:hypothetical protein
MDKHWNDTSYSIEDWPIMKPTFTDLELVQQSPFYIVNCFEPSEALQLAAVKINAEVLGVIENPDRTVIKYALAANGFTIKYIREPDEELQLLAIDLTSAPIMYIKNPTQTVTNQVLRDDDFIISSPNAYKNFVKRIFKGNNILINKWIRYCSNVRDLSINETK